jgi:hypothetical protein
MATNTTENPTQRGLGTSSTAALSEQFAAGQIVQNYDPAGEVKANLDGVQTGRPELGPFSLDYADAPEILDFVPNPTPPGPGDVNPSNKGPAPQTDWPPAPQGFPVGGGSQNQPNEFSADIAEQKFDALTLGES